MTKWYVLVHDGEFGYALAYGGPNVEANHGYSRGDSTESYWMYLNINMLIRDLKTINCLHLVSKELNTWEEGKDFAIMEVEI